MIRYVFICAFVAVWSVTAFASQNRQALSDQQILINIERDWDRAFLTKDIPFIQNVLADDVVVTYDNGTRGDKAKELSLAADFNQQVESSTLEDFIVKVNGDTAVVMFTRHLVGPMQGKRTEVTFRYLDVFAWRDNRWQCIATQSVRVDPPPA